MYRTLSLILICFLGSTCARAQESTKADSIEAEFQLISSIFKHADSKGNTEPFDSLLSTGLITTNEARAGLYGYKARRMAYYNNLPCCGYIDNSKLPSIVDSILLTYAFAIESSKTFLDKVRWQYDRHEFLQELTYCHSHSIRDSVVIIYGEGLNQLKSIGFRPKRRGFGLGANFVMSEEQWIGIDFSIKSAYTPNFEYYDKETGMYYSRKDKFKFPIAWNLVTLGYSRSLSSNINDFSFSLIEVNSPFVLIPAKVGAQLTSLSGTPKYYYRPTAGFGWGPVSVSYSYSIPFSKAEGIYSNRHMVNFRVHYPITNKYRVGKVK